MTGPLRRLKIEGDSLAGNANRVWVDGLEAPNVTRVELHIDAEGVNQAMLGILLVEGLNVDTVAAIGVDEQTSGLLVGLGWTPPGQEPDDGRETERSHRTLADYFVQYVPESARKAHELFAKALGYFWLPCPLCGAYSGGHEWRDIDGMACSIPDPDGAPGSHLGICRACTRAGRGVA